MTPLPKKKHTKGRTGRRRGGQPKIALPALTTCSNCGKKRLVHRLCEACGKK